MPRWFTQLDRSLRTPLERDLDGEARPRVRLPLYRALFWCACGVFE